MPLSGQLDNPVLGACQVQADDHIITPKAASIVRHMGPSFVSGWTREGITRTRRRCRLPLSHTLILASGRLCRGDRGQGDHRRMDGEVDYPHWGKFFPLTHQAVERMYPGRFAHFREICARYDPCGTFRNAYAQRVLGFAATRCPIPSSWRLPTARRAAIEPPADRRDRGLR